MTPIVPKILARIAIEREVVRRAVQGILAKGPSVCVSVDFGEGVYEVPYSRDAEEIMRTMFTDDGGLTVDDAMLRVHEKAKGGPLYHSKGWVRLIFGNDGWDVVNDYTTNLEDELKESNDLAERIGDGKVEALAECFQRPTLADAPTPSPSYVWPKIAEELLSICQELTDAWRSDGLTTSDGVNAIVDRELMNSLSIKVVEIHNEALKDIQRFTQIVGRVVREGPGTDAAEPICRICGEPLTQNDREDGTHDECWSRTR